MTEKFTNIEPEKQDRVITAALKEFSEHGYEKASTNRIVKQAGIGKGMLFYYFKNKKELYYYLIDYSIDYVTNEYLGHINENVVDFIERYRQIAQIKMKKYAENPHVFNFLGSIYINKDVKLPQELQKRFIDAREYGYRVLFRNVDTSLFRQDIDSDKILKLIYWTLEGYEQEILKKLEGQKLSQIDYEPYWDELDQYLDILKKVYYRQEGGKNDHFDSRQYY
ncbi:TetR/AcrR family transcriptional regulator [Natranaerobius thermophilus JW/NM-WN-LF]|nr:TetR/AcrR family transcriptional regulator [Natranaerobius thermophilus]